MELFPDVLVHRLKMVVDPADSSYMPSLVVVSGKNDLLKCDKCVDRYHVCLQLNLTF